MRRVFSCALAILVVAFSGSHAISAEKAEKITKDQLIGEWNYSPGVRSAFLLREDGSGVLRSGFGSHLAGDTPCNWDFNEHYQALVLATKQLKRQYKAKMEDGKIMLYEGRDVFFRGANLNTLCASPLDKAVKAPAVEGEKAEGKTEGNKPE
jgi:hypothetical protein